MTKSATDKASHTAALLVSNLRVILQSGLDPKAADPRLLRQVRVLNGLMFTAMAMCIPLGTFWAQVVEQAFGYVYAAAFLAWAGLIVLLRRTHQVTLVGRTAVVVLFGLCTASVVLLGGTESNLLAWYMLMPLAAAVCVGKRDLWFWGVVATATPVFIYLNPALSTIAPSPFTAEVNHKLSGIALALGALVVSILTNIWISHHERLAKKLDASVARLKREADAHRLLVETAMLASAESELNHGARKLLETIAQIDGVAAVAFWDARGKSAPGAPHYQLPQDKIFSPTPLLSRSIRTAKRSVAKTTDSAHRNLYYPIQDGEAVVGVLEVAVSLSYHRTQDGGWLLQQIAIQLGHIAERERTAQIIQHEARYDALTCLPNRRAFHASLEKEIDAARLQEKQVALLFIDLNDFKRVNDSLGHAAGDKVLQVIARRLQQAVRQADHNVAGPKRIADSISRVGGDEFTLVLEDINSGEDADRAAQRILDSLASPILLDGQQFRVGASVGIAIYPDDAQQADLLVQSADAAMYAAKRRGRTGYSRYRDADKAVDSLSFEVELRRAITAGQLEMHYQPVFSCATDQPVGAEALIRWQHPERGWIPPSDFIPLAESLGLIGEIGRFQFDTVLSWFASIRGQLPKDFRMALNLSPNQVEDPEFAKWLLDRLAKTQVPMENIELEITETALLADTPETRANIGALANLGLCITLDDFGTGQSSLSLLKRFPIGRIKIDQSFVSGLPNRSEDVAIVGAVLSLASSLDIPVVAEGVEEEAQKLFLAHRQCDDMQGYLLARPMPGDQLIDRLGASAPVNTLQTAEALSNA